MVHDRDRQSGSEGVFIAALVIAVLLGGLSVLGLGAFFYTRAVTFERQAVMQRELALEAHHQAEQARAQAQMVFERNRPAEAELDATESIVETIDAGGQPIVDSGNAARRTAIQIDAEGNLQMDGAPTSHDELATFLRSIADRSEPQLVTVEVDEQCVFQHVAGILKLCDELEIKEVKLTPMSDRHSR